MPPPWTCQVKIDLDARLKQDPLVFEDGEIRVFQDLVETSFLNLQGEAFEMTGSRRRLVTESSQQVPALTTLAEVHKLGLWPFLCDLEILMETAPGTKFVVKSLEGAQVEFLDGGRRIKVTREFLSGLPELSIVSSSCNLQDGLNRFIVTASYTLESPYCH